MPTHVTALLNVPMSCVTKPFLAFEGRRHPDRTFPARQAPSMPPTRHGLGPRWRWQAIWREFWRRNVRYSFVTLFERFSATLLACARRPSASVRVVLQRSRPCPSGGTSLTNRRPELCTSIQSDGYELLDEPRAYVNSRNFLTLSYRASPP